MLIRTRRAAYVALAFLGGWCAGTATGQEVRNINGTRYQITRNVTTQQVPTTVMQNRQQTVYAQQLTTNTLNHQQLYCVPTTSYQWDTRLRGRWNPFVTPYWTYNLRPVTTWSTQVANVQIPVNQVAWVPQVQTVQVPVTEYRNAEVVTETRVALGPGNGSVNTGLANAQPLNGPSATIAARPSSTATSSSTPLGGQALDNDPPRQGSGWQSPSTLGNRY